jgi:two-component system chemotaxis response regulator CheY
MAGYDFTRLNALVVDDYRYMRTLLAEMLREFGFHQVLTADDGIAATAILRASAIDVVFIDWHMPNLDGVAFTQGVRRGEYGNDPYLPILMVSGRTEQSSVRRALDAGVHSYVLKPITPQSLAERLSQLIENPPRFVKTDDYFGPYRQPLTQQASTDWPTRW